MKCMKCGYISFDHNDECPKCGKEMSAEKTLLGTARLAPFPSSLSDPFRDAGIVPPPKDLTVDDFEAPRTPSKSDSLLLRLREEMAPLISPFSDAEATQDVISDNFCLEMGLDEESGETAGESIPNGKIPNLEGLASIVEEINHSDGEKSRLEEEEPDGLEAPKTSKPLSDKDLDGS